MQARRLSWRELYPGIGEMGLSSPQTLRKALSEGRMKEKIQLVVELLQPSNGAPLIGSVTGLVAAAVC